MKRHVLKLRTFWRALIDQQMDISGEWQNGKRQGKFRFVNNNNKLSSNLKKKEKKMKKWMFC